MELCTLLAQTTPVETATASFDFIGYVLRVIHILAAVVLGGGIFYQWLVVLPTLKVEGTPGFLEAARKSWSAMVGMAALVLIAGGLYNYILTKRTFDVPKAYDALWGIKFLLALGVFFISSVLSGRTSLAKKFREKAAVWLTLNVLLILLILLLASALRSLPHTPKPAVKEATAWMQPVSPRAEFAPARQRT